MEQAGNINVNQNLNVVAIGGGTGLSTLLSGLKSFVREPEAFISIRDLSAIVAVTDDGGSSGRLRTELRMLPPGDIRNCMVALSEDSLLLSRLFRYRFKGEGGLSGHSFGNLFLAALSELTGDFAEAVRLSSGILASKGQIFPATTTANVHLIAELDDGTTVQGETRISQIGPSMNRLYLEPETCHPVPDAIEAIENADIITIGPGSLYTSLVPPLLVKGVAESIGRARAEKIYIGNLMTQPGETTGLTAAKHVTELRKYSPEIAFDQVILNSQAITNEQRIRYALEGSIQIGINEGKAIADACNAKIVYANLLSDGEKVRHDPERLAAAVLSCASATAAA
jgi:uncharacterized cofD-like protein